jgi:asparagine synthase (glutamine-hydrolysing)
MSGIAGTFNLDGRTVDESKLPRMLYAMAHRGPDGRGVWSNRNAALGHCLMRTSPEAPEDPRILVRNELAITADVRLDNRDELISQLGLSDRGASDAELILAAYEKKGESCPELLLGDFAFAIWDDRRRLLFCARDHFGVKPFFYSANATGFAFASEMKALFALPEVTDRLDDDRIADYLVGLADSQSTVYRDILRVPARHSLTVTATGQRLREYWQPKTSAVSSGDAAEQFRDIFATAIRCRRRSARPVGAMLSGGLDSSSIACVAADQHSKERGGKLTTLSLVFDRTPALSERRFIEAVLARGGFDSVFDDLGDHAPFADFDRVLAEQEGPFLAPGVAFTRRLYRMAAERGLGIVLDGHGGDEVVSHGQGRLHELARAGHWLGLWREVGGLARATGYSHWPTYAAYVERYAAGGRLGRLRRRIRRSASAGPAWSRFVSTKLAARSNLADRYREQNRKEVAASTEESSWQAWIVFSNRRPQSLEVLDKLTAAAGVEGRYPFWDKRLLEFCLSLPSKEKLDGGWSRLILRRAMEGILPPAVQWRTDKLNFGPHIIRGMLAHHRALIDRILDEDAVAVGEYVDLPAIREAYRRITEKQEAADGFDVQAVWKTVVLATWLRQLSGTAERASVAA